MISYLILAYSGLVFTVIPYFISSVWRLISRVIPQYILINFNHHSWWSYTLVLNLRRFKSGFLMTILPLQQKPNIHKFLQTGYKLPQQRRYMLIWRKPRWLGNLAPIVESCSTYISSLISSVALRLSLFPPYQRCCPSKKI